MKLIIAGTRSFKDRAIFDRELNKLIVANKWKVTEVVSGGCQGADRLGETWAATHGIPCRIFGARWDKNGKSAGPTRNQRIAKYVAVAKDETGKGQVENALVVFWDQKSPGTANMMTEANNLDIPVYNVDINKIGVVAREKFNSWGLPDLGYRIENKLKKIGKGD